MHFRHLVLSACLAISPPHTYAAANPDQLGARFDATQTKLNFKVFSSRATRVEVYLYRSPKGVQEVARIPMNIRPGNVWSLSLPVGTLARQYGLTGTVYYGYRAWGPNWPYANGWTKGSNIGFISDVDAAGNRFNPNKLLSDPYALELSHDPAPKELAEGAIYASGPLYRHTDNGSEAPKSIVLRPDTRSTGMKPIRALKDDVIYEAHVRGLTMNDDSIPAAYRGTYKGAGMKAAALAGLGITAIEFLPVQETQNDNHELNPTTTLGDNYWGYMTLNYFAPDRRYASDKSAGGPTREFKDMVKVFHDAGIKVLIDVVYNHTGEGGAWHLDDKNTYNLYSWRGLDNPTYYSLSSDKQHNVDNTGVGGNYNTRNLVAQNLIIDSLVYWRDAMGVDGYRFDLAPILGNSCEHGCFNFDKQDASNAINRITNELPPRPGNGGSGMDLIAEPWAIGGNSYQVGGFPSAWAEWNGMYRDTLRKDQNVMGGEAITPGQLAMRFTGSSDLYQDDGRKPWHSINFITAHDGFTLKDLYSCNSKNNLQSWPYGPSDGGEDFNFSWNQDGIAADQRKAARNALALLLLSGGTPMLVAGDEYLRTLNCNNNPYNLDSRANWLNWQWTTDQTQFRTFTQRMIAFRKAHPALRPANFYSAVDLNGNGMEQLRWFRSDGGVADAAYFDNANNHAIAWRIDGTELGDSAAALYVAYNGWRDSVPFSLPWPGTGRNWYRVADSCAWAEGNDQVRNPGMEDLIGAESTPYTVCGRGVVVLIAK
ncbi:glycogen debranching protein [Chitinimonas sp. BJB300]|uniref:glycogen debranching protein n=1 Tax=Chitinimonas sp. BJB300 TaxID=1559339 RepID=UPI000C0D4379|nr:isoamylase [Chitinimonas sp. BJB300]PHV11954.1 glycogen debranching enzyme [Chitinimonas sp. BJB300]TSJ87282.1 glycogen-debranching protein [Chitinimonas sp. BJB300]